MRPKKVQPNLTMLAALLVVALWNTSPETLSTITERACTSFCLDNNGQAIFGTNYDNQIWEGLLFVNKRGVTKTGWEAGTSGQYARWTAQYGSVAFNLAGDQMAWAGMNEAGLTISTMWLGETRDHTPDQRPPLISPLWVQYQLDTAATIEEVVANDARVRIFEADDHYLICDRSGACAVAAFLGGKTVFTTGDAISVKALTNHRYDKAIKAWQAGLLEGNALLRFGIAADRVTGFEPGDTPSAVAYAFETLDLASGQATGGSPTQWSIVFDTQNLHVHWRTSHNPQIRSIDFAKLDFACGTPVSVLDVHALLSGDVSHQLDTYSFEDNLQRTLSFLEKWGNLGLSPFEVEILERGLTNFPCERPTAPYQESKDLLIPPVVGWVALALFHRLWPVAVIAGITIASLIVWRVRTRRRQ